MSSHQVILQHFVANIMSASPISNLDDDILLSIFEIITSQIPDRRILPADRPLSIIRVASQVCWRWRALLLSSPLIWGRLIDLHELYGQRKIKWMEEVARRSESAPLWIYGRVGKPSEDSQGFNVQSYFMRLLDSWERIEKISVVIAPSDNKILGDIQNCFLCRAPILTLFDVVFSSIGDPLFLDTCHSGSALALFADYAPSLRTIKADQVAYKLDSPWLSNIREIHRFPQNLTLNDILVLLQHTPVIEKIAVNGQVLDWDRNQPPVPKLPLPNLSSMILWTNFEVLAAILDHISPGKLSTFVVRVWHDHHDNMDDPSTIFPSLKKDLPIYFSNYLTWNSPTALLLRISTQKFALWHVANTSFPGDLQNFKIIINSYSATEHWESIVTCFLDAFAASLGGNPSILRSVTEFRLPRIEVHPTLIQTLHSILILFRHVEVIHANEKDGNALWTLSCLGGTSHDPQLVLFPELHTVRLTTLEEIEDDVCNDLTLFLRSRKDIGFPVAELDLTSCNRSNYVQDLRDLEAVAGLEVVWRTRGDGSGENHGICSYICGSGDPERLQALI